MGTGNSLFLLRCSGFGMSHFFRSQIVQDVSALWAVATFIFAVIYFSELVAALVLMARAV